MRTVVGRLPKTFLRAVDAADLGDTPLALAVVSPAGLVEHAQGHWPDGTPVSSADRFYGASLTKQLTGAAIALLVRRGVLDVDVAVGHFLPDLPSWRHAVTLRHLLHHTSGLSDFGAMTGEGHWTNARAFAHLRTLANPEPGRAEQYSNLGYIGLAAVVEAVSAQSFARFVSGEITGPLGLSAIELWEGDPDLPFPQRTGLGLSLPLSTGDGGLWTSAADFARWLDAQNRDVMGIADLVQQPGQLADGTQTTYGWGIGLRSFRGHPLYIHGGGWTNVANKALRCPALGLSVVVLSSAPDIAPISELADALLAIAVGD